MKQLAQYQDGRLELQDVPAPTAPPGGILVRTACSVISPGTEKMKVEQARMSLLQKARARPDQLRKVVDTARTLGWKSALEKVRNRLESPAPLGYSAAGTVVAVDEGNTRFRVGDRVACGGAECAFHAELIAVPDLLAAPVPDGVADWQAAYTTLAAISMEAVRQSGARLGDRVLVMGQGLVGLLATALLRASGARVMASDPVAARLSASTAMGAERTVNPLAANLENESTAWSGGHGVDSVLLCIGGHGRQAVEAAISCLRDRGVIVIVGMHDAEFPWKSAYMKDITVRYSRSYGPGRYDTAYEWGGRDYPIGHVRWTENRNFEACLDLMRRGSLDLAPLTTRRAGFNDAVSVYDELLRAENTDIGVVLEYGPQAGLASPAASLPSPDPATAPRSAARHPPCRTLDVVGAGNFARTMLLPHVKGRIALGTVVNAGGLSARHAKEKFGFSRAATDPADVLAKQGGALMIGTRHHLHARQVIGGLQSGKHVFVEKPLCLTRGELSQIDSAVSASQGSVMVGFNRRFAPATAELKKILADIRGPKALAFHVFAGPLDPDHWYANHEESGGRVLGESCHFWDFACFVLDAKPLCVSAQTLGHIGGRQPFPDSIAAQAEFDDGSSFQLIYSSEGDPAFPKETFRIFAGGLVAECENFQRLTLCRNRRRTTRRFSGKGHAEEIAAWLAFLAGEASHPLPYAASRQSMLLTFAVLESIRENRIIEL